MPGFKVPAPGGVVGEGVDPNVTPYYTYTWEVRFLFGENIENTAVIYAKDATLPAFAVNRGELEGSSVIYKYPESVNWEDVRLSFYDIKPVNGPPISSYLKKWRQRVWTAQDGIKMSEGSFFPAKKQSNILYWDASEDNQHKWELYGSWPQLIREGDLSYTNSDVKLLEVTVVYDWAEWFE